MPAVLIHYLACPTCNSANTLLINNGYTATNYIKCLNCFKIQSDYYESPYTNRAVHHPNIFESIQNDMKQNDMKQNDMNQNNNHNNKITRTIHPNYYVEKINKKCINVAIVIIVILFGGMMNHIYNFIY